MDAATLARRRESAYRQIAREGAEGVWRVLGPSAGDPEKPWRSTGDGFRDEFQAIAAFFSAGSAPGAAALGLVPGTDVVKGTGFMLVPYYPDFKPTPKHVFNRTKDSRDFAVVAVDPISPSGDDICYIAWYK